MAKTVAAGQEPVGTLGYTVDGLNVPARFRDHEALVVIRTRWVTSSMTGSALGPTWTLMTPTDIFRDPTVDRGYIKNEHVDAGQLGILLGGEMDAPELFDVRLQGPFLCPFCADKYEGDRDDLACVHDYDHVKDHYGGLPSDQHLARWLEDAVDAFHGQDSEADDD